MVLELLLVVGNASTNDTREIILLVSVNDQFSCIPVGVDFLAELLLNLLLLKGRVTDILDIFLDAEEISFKKLLECEGLRLVRDILASELDELLPMTVLNGLITEHLDEGQDDLHIVKALLELLVRGVLLGVRWQLEAVLQELLNAFLHAHNLTRDFEPGGLFPLGDRLGHFKVESVELVKLVELIAGLCEAWVGLVGQSEELLT